MGNEVSIEGEQPNLPTQGVQNSTEQRRTRPAQNQRSAAAQYADPVFAAAAAGAAAKKAHNKNRRRRPKPSPAQLPFQISVDNDWKASLQRFAETAASTANNVAKVATPILADAATAVRDTATEFSESYNNADGKPDERREDRVDTENDATIIANNSTPSQDGMAPPALTEEDVLPKTRTLIQKETPTEVKEDSAEERPATEVETPLETIEREALKSPVPFTIPPDAVTRLKDAHESSRPVRRRRVAQLQTTPAAFAGGDYVSRRPPRAASPFLDDLSMDSFMTPGPRRDFPTSMDSVASTQSGHSRIRNVLDNSQHLLTTPKQLVDIVARRLVVDDPISSSTRLGRSRRSNSRRSRSSTPIGWVPNVKSFDGLDRLNFAGEPKFFAPNLSPPGSPISEAAMRRHEPPQNQPPMPVVTLWDMIPDDDDADDEAPAQESPSEQKTMVFEPSPSELMIPLTPRRDESSSGGGSIDAMSTDKLRRRRALRRRDDGASIGIESTSKHRRRGMRHRRKTSAMRSLASRFSDDDTKSTFDNQSVASMRLDVAVEKKKPMYVPDASTGRLPEFDDEWQGPRFPVHEDDGLNESLMMVSSLSNLGLDKGFPRFKIPPNLEKIASLRWRQLVANWKHFKTIEAMTSHPTSLHFVRSANSNDEAYRLDGGSSSSSTTSVHFVRKPESILTNSNVLAGTENVSGRSPLFHADVPVLSSFLTNIGCNGEEKKSEAEDEAKEESQPVLRHDIDIENPTLPDLLRTAGSKMNAFNELIRKVVAFVKEDESPIEIFEHDDAGLSYAIDLKSESAINAKAERKYKGDVSQVKDILRASIMFPGQGSLVCAFAFLDSFSRKAEPDSDDHIEILRVKNLLHVLPSGNLCLSTLPTGYRHILITIRLSGGLLAGKLNEQWERCQWLLAAHRFHRNSVSLGTLVPNYGRRRIPPAPGDH